MIRVKYEFREESDLGVYEVVVGDWDNSREDGTEQRFDIANITVYPDYKSVLSSVMRSLII